MVALRRAPPPSPPSPPLPRPPPPPLLLYLTSISNGRHGVFSPPPPCGTGYLLRFFPVEQDIPLLLHPLPHRRAFCASRAREEGEPAPPLFNRMVFPFVNVWPFYLPTALLWKRMVFPFALRHIHTLAVDLLV